jgi:hypothetical protein
MTPIPPDLSEVSHTLIRVLAASRDATAVSAVALLSVGETLFAMLQSGLATDLRRAKESILRGMEGRAEQQQARAKELNAKAEKLLGEAAALHEQREAVRASVLAFNPPDVAPKRLLESEREAGGPRRLTHETPSVGQRAEAEGDPAQQQAIAAAEAELRAAIARLRQLGGDLLLDGAQLEQLLQRAGQKRLE